MHSLMNTCSQPASQPASQPVSQSVSQVFVDMNTYILTKGRNFKTFLKENYAVGLVNCYLFTKKVLNIKLNVMLF